MLLENRTQLACHNLKDRAKPVYKQARNTTSSAEDHQIISLRNNGLKEGKEIQQGFNRHSVMLKT